MNRYEEAMLFLLDLTRVTLLPGVSREKLEALARKYARGVFPPAMEKYGPRSYPRCHSQFIPEEEFLPEGLAEPWDTLVEDPGNE